MENPEIHDTLMEAFRRIGADGEYYYSDAEVHHFLPYIFFRSSIPFDSLPLQFQQQVIEVLRLAGASPTASGPELMRALDAYYLRSPVNGELAAQFQRTMRSALASGQIGAVSDAVRRIFTTQVKRAPDGKRVPGTLTLASLMPRGTISGR